MTAGMEESATRPLRVVIVDDSSDMRTVLRVRLQLDGFAVVGEAEDGDEGIRLVAQLQPAIAVLDLEMKNLSGVVALPAIRRVSPKTAVVVFSWFPDPFTLGHLLELGADAYVDKAGGPAVLVDHLKALASVPRIPFQDLDDDVRLAGIRAELKDMNDARRHRLLRPAEQRRYDHLLAVEERLLRRAWQTH